MASQASGRAASFTPQNRYSIMEGVCERTRGEGLEQQSSIVSCLAAATFQDVVGQQHITQTLHNSLKENKVSHAYLFSGPRGTGKTSTAKILAKAVNCERGLELAPCNECSACLRIQSGAVMDVVEIDAATPTAASKRFGRYRQGQICTS